MNRPPFIPDGGGPSTGEMLLMFAVAIGCLILAGIVGYVMRGPC